MIHYQQLKSFWSCSHTNCCLQNTIHLNLHILFIVQLKTSRKIQELQESIKYIESYQENNIEFLDEFDFQFVFHLNFKKTGFSGDSMTQCKCESHVNVNHM